MASIGIPGGQSSARPPQQLGTTGKAALQFVIQKVPNVGKLKSFTSQIVNGVIFRFTFTDYQGVITVLSVPRENNFLQITLPTGEIINNQEKAQQILLGVTGGKSKPKSQAQLGQNGKAALQFVRDNVPNLGNLVSFTTQVVGGIMYRFTFSNYEGEIAVWSKQWLNNFLEVTLPNGEKFNNVVQLVGSSSQKVHKVQLLGAPSDPKPPSQLGSSGEAIVKFVRERVPNLGDLISFTTQVVGGTMWAFTFSNYKGEISVFSRPWENKLQLILPKSEIVQVQVKIHEQPKAVGVPGVPQARGIPGGISHDRSPDELRGGALIAYQFVRAKVPNLGDLISWTNQIVAGHLYQFNFKNSKEEISVYRSWDNSLEIILPNGQKISDK